MATEQEELKEKLSQQWDMEIPATVSEAEILQQIAARISRLLQGNAETFFQLMYRLDIAEWKLTEALQYENAPDRVAQLVYDRQLQKIQSRRQSKEQGNAADPDLGW